jgi:hypothetical protein
MAAQRPSSPDRTGRPGGGLATAGWAAGWRARATAAGSATLARAAGRWALAAAGWALAAARGETGRRLARATTLTLALAVLITTLYDRGEAPRAAAQPAVAAPTPGGPGGAAARARADAARRQDPGDVGGLRGRPRPKVGERPAAVAAAWYAARQGLPAAKVQALQQDRRSATEVRVLVLADHGHGRLRTALVRVRRGPAGWSVR